MEHTIEFSVVVREETNKDTYLQSYTSAVDAVQALLPLLTEEERLEVMRPYCKACGSNDPRCVCMRDD
jgi:hypothetical protein